MQPEEFRKGMKIKGNITGRTYQVLDIKNNGRTLVLMDTKSGKMSGWPLKYIAETHSAVHETPKQGNLDLKHIKKPEPEITGNLLAVYGTLKKGYGNHRLIERAKLVSFQNAITEKEYYMTGFGFPYSFKNAPADVAEAIKVELYYFKDEKDLVEIDELEGHPRWYTRELVDVTTTGGKKCKAWMYLRDYSEYNATQHDGVGSRIIREKGVAEWR
jgi:gamma-glutamylaminecyclotransferase